MSAKQLARPGRPVVRDKAPHGSEERYQYERWLHYRKHDGPPPCADCKAAHAAHERARAAAAPSRPRRSPTATDRARRARLADLRWMAEHGETFDGAAARLDIDPAALDRWVRRNPAAKPAADRLRANAEPWGHVRAGRVASVGVGRWAS